MDDTMSHTSNETILQGSRRRAFFRQLLIAVGGGFLGGNLMQRLFSSRKPAREDDRPVTIRINPLAVPRSKEGSKSNV